MTWIIDSIKYSLPLILLIQLEFAPGCRIIDFFSSHFSFHSFNKCSDETCSHQLDEMIIVSSENPSHTLVITDASIKNNVATSIAHVYIHNRPVVKTIHHAVNINSMEAKLFAIRCGINQATNSMRVLKIVIITDSIHAAKKIFDLLLHLFQTHLAFILCELPKFFALNQDNSIEFWECPSQYN